MSDQERTRTRFVPPSPSAPASPHPAAVDSSEDAKKSPAFREALKDDDAREAQASFQPDRDLWGRTGAGPDVAKTPPEESQKREEGRARREEGYK